MLCEQDREDRTIEARKRLIEKMKNTLKTQLMPDMRKANDFLNKIEKWYKKSGVEREESMQIDMYYPLAMQASYFLAMAKFSQAGKIFMDLFHRYKEIDFYISTYSLFQAVESFNFGFNRSELENALKTFKDNFIGDYELMRFIFMNRFTEMQTLIDLFEKL